MDECLNTLGTISMGDEHASACGVGVICARSILNVYFGCLSLQDVFFFRMVFELIHIG